MSHMKKFEHLKIELEAIKSATNNFADESCIGKGGFGKVYKAEIAHSEGHKMVALKRLNREFGQGDPEFWKEIMMLSLYKHKNIVSLLGYCDDFGEKILVYPYESKRSLDLHINKHELTWVGRLRICIGAARGLAYLHSAPIGTQQRVLHRDIKSSNILLDENWNGKISDFGLSKFGPANQEITFVVSNAVGTRGYVDPLYAETGLLTKESDLYSFGVVLFEVLCGRLCLDNSNNTPGYLVELAQQSYEQNTLNEIIYDNIKDKINPDSLKTYSTIAYQCLKRNIKERPLMNEIVTALETALQYQINEVRPKTHVPILDCTKVLKKQPIGILNVKVVRAMKLKRVYRVFRPDTYVKLRLTNDELPFKETKVKVLDTNPEWNEDFDLTVKDLDAQALEIVVCRDRSGEFNRSWIKFVPLKDLKPEKRNILTFDLFVNMNSNDSQGNKSYGQITVEMMFQALTDDQILNDFKDASGMQKALAGGGVLVVTIHEGKHLRGYPFISMTLQNDRKKTTPAKKGSDPVWEEEFTFTLEKPPTNEKLHLEVHSILHMDKLFGKENLGYVDISLADVVKKKRTKEIYHLKSSTSGWLHVELKWATFT